MSTFQDTRSDALACAASAVRQLSVDAILKAGSGHIGLPLGCAELGALLYGEILKHNPSAPEWPDRDRFILSAGHGSMLLYSLLHLSGYDVSMNDLRGFRTLGSRTPGHPEYGVTPGVETTTGQLGQGFANAIGMAIAEQMLAKEFNTKEITLVDHNMFVLVGDGDLMEGVSYEAASLAGHLGLSKLIVFYDSNRITIDGMTELAFSDNIQDRFESCAWHVLEADAYDRNGILNAVDKAQNEIARPSLIVVTSVIGSGLDRVQGTSDAHGGPLFSEDAQTIRGDIKEYTSFTIGKQAYAYFVAGREEGVRRHNEWKADCEQYRTRYPEKYARFVFRNSARELRLPQAVPSYAIGTSVATRVSNGQVLDVISKADYGFTGGAADLTVPCFGPDFQVDYFTAENRGGWYVPFGVREHAMGAVCNGIALHGGHRVFCGTFLAFSDYMRPAIRLSALMRLPVIYVLTHDSIRIGQDGPTHQPVEHMAALRSIPNLSVIRPADAMETIEAWRVALENVDGPTAIILTRQDVEVFERKNRHWQSEFTRGAYIVDDANPQPELVIVATGSEVADVLAVKRRLPEHRIRVVSMPCRERFLMQSRSWKQSVIPDGVPVLVVEACVAQGWHEIGCDNTHVISIETFGASGPGEQVADHFGFSVADITEQIRLALH